MWSSRLIRLRAERLIASGLVVLFASRPQPRRRIAHRHPIEPLSRGLGAPVHTLAASGIRPGLFVGSCARIPRGARCAWPTRALIWKKRDARRAGRRGPKLLSRLQPSIRRDHLALRGELDLRTAGIAEEALAQAEKSNERHYSK